MRVFRRLLAPLALLLLALFAVPRAGVAQVAVSVTVAPPALPVYVQPPLPGPGWMWAPGYWAWGPYGYYWVPGTWVRPPRVGFLWTPGYWGWLNGAYIWHAGYWGPHIGFYGGVNYGFGYIGAGFFGGYWDHGAYRYNAAVNNFGGAHITNVYRQTTVNNIDITRTVGVTHVSFNGGRGGRGGIAAQPTQQELAAAHDQHAPATALQVRHATMAQANPGLRLATNHGHPAIAATPRPAAFAAHGVVHAQGAAPDHPQPVRRANAAERPHGPGPQPQHPSQDHQHQSNEGGPARPE